MRNLIVLRRILLLLIIISLSSCSFFQTYFTAKEKSLEFVNAFLDEDFSKCIDLMALKSTSQIKKDTMRLQLKVLKANIDTAFGKNLKPTFLSAITDENNIGEKTVIHHLGLVQLANDNYYGNCEVRFDNETGEVDNVKVLFKKPVPDKSNLYLFGGFALIVLSVNLFSIWKVIKSTLAKKWKWILAIVVLNYPVLVYSFERGPFLNWANIQMMCGVSYSFADIDGMKIMMGLPIGAIWVLYKLYNNKNNNLQESDS